MTTWNDYFPSKWLKADDIGDKALVLTVKSVDFEPIGEDREMKAVLRFNETEKGLVLNKTNATTLQSLFGNDPVSCIGKRIGLFTAAVTFGGRTTMGVRVHPKLPAARPVAVAAPQAPEPPEDDVLWAEPDGAPF